MPRKKSEAAEGACAAEIAVPVRSRAAAKSDPTEEIVLQCAGCEWNIDALKEKAIDAYAAEGHKRDCIAKLSLYLKPEERKAYYVVNDKTSGSIDME